MFKKLFFIGAYCTIAIIASAQPNNSDSVLTNKPFAPILGLPKTNKSETDYSKNLLKFNLLGALQKGLDISYERKIAPKWSLNLNSVTKMHINGGDFFVSNRNSYYYSQTLGTQVRYYHNLERRKRLGKNAHFSGNYFALETSANYEMYHIAYHPLPKNIYRYEYTTNLLYGIQRKISKRVYFDANVGVGVKQYGTVGEFRATSILPTAKIGIGIAL